VIPLALDGFYLRDWRESDAPAMLRAINNPKIARNMADWYPSEGYTLELAQEWVRGGHKAMPGSNWALCAREERDEVIGAGGVHPQSGFARCNAEIGYWLAEAYWGRGVGTALVASLTAQAFALPGITRVFAPIHAHNIGSQRVCEKNGFVCEGLRRKSVMKWGEAIDTVVWAKYSPDA
jgi:[ribosomal protein S5]-alanine N-acetyltransferase